MVIEATPSINGLTLASGADTAGPSGRVHRYRSVGPLDSEGERRVAERPAQPRIASIAVSTARTTRMAAATRVIHRTDTTRARRLPP
jgi:hypothetical protein